jgi:hypothetical protein
MGKRSDFGQRRERLAYMADLCMICLRARNPTTVVYAYWLLALVFLYRKDAPVQDYRSSVAWIGVSPFASIIQPHV